MPLPSPTLAHASPSHLLVHSCWNKLFLYSKWKFRNFSYLCPSCPLFPLFSLVYQLFLIPASFLSLFSASSNFAFSGPINTFNEPSVLMNYSAQSMNSHEFIDVLRANSNMIWLLGHTPLRKVTNVIFSFWSFVASHYFSNWDMYSFKLLSSCNFVVRR